MKRNQRFKEAVIRLMEEQGPQTVTQIIQNVRMRDGQSPKYLPQGKGMGMILKSDKRFKKVGEHSYQVIWGLSNRET